MLTAEDKSFIARALAMHAMLTRSALAPCELSLEDMVDLIDVVANRPADGQTCGGSPPSSSQSIQSASETKSPSPQSS